MPMVDPTIAQIATVGELEANQKIVAKSAGSGEPVFTLMDVVGTQQTIALRQPIVKQKKGSTVISLFLNYCSMGSFLSLFHDTVPLFRD
jgi:hypothetical protein